MMMKSLEDLVDEIISTSGDGTGSLRMPPKLFRKVVEWAYSDGRLSALKEQREALQEELDILQRKRQ